MLKKISLILLPAVLLVACGGKPKDISDLENATPADSMMYYFGEMQAAIYWQDAETDTLLRSEEARKMFMKGFRDALAMDHQDSAYNKGLALGLRLALRLQEFEDRYNTKFSDEILAASLENYLKSDSSYNLSDARKGYYAIKDRLELNAANEELGTAVKNLAKDAPAMGFEMLSDTLYYKDITPGMNVPKFTEGDRVAVEVTASTIDGKEIVTRQFPDSLTLGEGRVPNVVLLGIYTMSEGQTRQFMTTPRTLLGKRYKLYNLPADEPVIFTVKASR